MNALQLFSLRKATIPFCTMLIVLGGSAHAQQHAKQPSTHLRFFLGYTTQSLTELNAAIEDDERIFHSFGIPVSWDTFGGALEYGAELDLMVSEVTSLGASVGVQGSDVNNLYSDWSGSVSDKMHLKVIDVSGTLTFWLPSSPGMHIGISGGVAFGSADSRTRLTIYDDPGSSFDLDAEFSGKGLSLGVFGGYQARLGATGLVSLKAGYRHRKLGEFDGRVCSVGDGCADDSASNNSGQPLDFDFSGFYLRAGVGFAFGG